MPKKIQLKTSKNKKTISSYIKSLPKEKQTEARLLNKLFSGVTGVKGKMWGDSIVGYGEYIYHRSNGDEGLFMATGFSMRASGPTLYIMPGYSDYSKVLKDLGPHKLGKSCLYLKTLDDVNLKIIEKLIKAGLKDLKKSHTIKMI